MKLRLVVANGVHTGKAIPITIPQFVIGRDPQCQLRPASPAISKRHCAVLVRGSQVLVRDFGSTNGTFVNGQLVQGEAELHDGDNLKVGPLDFTVGLELTAAPNPAAPAAAKPVAAAVKPAVAAAKPVAATAQPAAAPPAAPPPAQEDEAVDMTAEPSAGPASDKIAELLLDDDGAAPAASSTLDTAESVPEGSTVMELPSANAKPGQQQAKKSVIGTGNTSSAADQILRKYLRRPRG
jgi:pSer/pThr/pTyr-binding forkhead associated (FHA) protein